MDGGERFYRVLLDRFESLELSHRNLKEQFQVVVQEKSGGAGYRERDASPDSSGAGAYPGWADISWAYFAESPYKRVLENLGHALHVSSAVSGEIIYWNYAAEKLYGYKDYEVVGQRALELLFNEEHHHFVIAILERLRTGQSWSGQLPLKRRSGQTFIALITKSPLYEDGELSGIVTVSSDATVFNKSNLGNMKPPNEQSKFRRLNLKNLQWQNRPQIAAVPHLASSVSNLASKVLSRVTSDTCRNAREGEEGEEESQDTRSDRPPRVPIGKGGFNFPIGRSRTDTIGSEKEELASGFSQPSKLAVKFLEKLHIGARSNSEKDMDDSIQHNCSVNNSTSKGANGLHIHNLDASNNAVEHTNFRAFPGCFEVNRYADQTSNKQSDSQKNPSSDESSSSKGDNDPHVVVNSMIQWEDLQLKEEIGQGSFAVVYRGIWNGSDVAVKVYCGNQYAEGTLLDYKKEIDIMRRLRHPNVLLFMGAACTEERIAIVTEYMIRGSLFKTLHKNSQALDIRRRLRMALDVARGVNYLHHRNPPIVHRDLKSSNLLVDKSWTVKVGDFGLSKLKYATFLTARSGRGTPQWMAPEVLRNERSTEKSDVFSFGVVLWELMTERIPWSDLNSLQVVGVVGFMDRRLDIPSNVDPQVSSIISECWRSNPEERPSFKEIIHRMTNLVVQAGGGVPMRM